MQENVPRLSVENYVKPSTDLKVWNAVCVCIPTIEFLSGLFFY